MRKKRYPIIAKIIRKRLIWFIYLKILLFVQWITEIEFNCYSSWCVKTNVTSFDSWSKDFNHIDTCQLQQSSSLIMEFLCIMCPVPCCTTLSVDLNHNKLAIVLLYIRFYYLATHKTPAALTLSVYHSLHYKNIYLLYYLPFMTILWFSKVIHIGHYPMGWDNSIVSMEYIHLKVQLLVTKWRITPCNWLTF